MHRELISRRRLLCAGGALLLQTSDKWAFGQTPAPNRPASGQRGVTLIKEIKNAGLLDVSGDSRKLCLYFSRRPVRSFRWQGEWKENTSRVRNGEDALRVLDTNTWTAVYAMRLPALPFGASFFRDGEDLYVYVPGVAGGATDHVLVNLQRGTAEERLERPGKEGLNFSYWALDDRMFLGGGRNSVVNRTEVLIKAEAPEYNEVARVPFAERRGPPDSSREAPITVAADRRTFVYAHDSNLVCRSAQSLETLWTRAGDPALKFWRVGISADGAVVAAAAADTVWVGGSVKHYVGIFSGHDGKELTRLPALGVEGVAISQDGKILAAGQRVPLQGKKSGTQPTVTLFDMASGKELATLIHDQFYGGGGEFLYAGVTTMFSPDGRYLITSGLNTKIWQIAGA